MDLDIYEHLVLRSLELGVPHEIAAAIFELPAETTKELQKHVRIERFNTADMQEFLEAIQWDALERAAQMLRAGSPDQAAKIVSAVFGRQIQAAGKRPSSALEDARANLLEMFRDVREAPPQGARAGRFVMGRTDVDRRANRDEEDTG